MVSHRQGSDESISEFLQASLKTVPFLMWPLICIARNSLVTPSWMVSLLRKRLLKKEELSLNQAFELADKLDRAHRYSSCMGPLVPDQSLSMTTSDSTAKNYDAAASTRRSSSTVIKAVSCFFCGLDTHWKWSLCPARNVFCHICGKLGHFARVCRSKAAAFLNLFLPQHPFWSRLSSPAPTTIG